MLLAPEQRCAQQLLFHAPLFLPLCSEQYQQLELLVVGSTAFAQEYVRNAYYMGQLLFPGTDRKIPLTIHCVAENEDARKQMEQALRHRMPEVFEPHVEQRAGRIRFYAAEPLSAAFDQLLEQVAGQVSTVLVDPQRNTGYRMSHWTCSGGSCAVSWAAAARCCCSAAVAMLCWAAHWSGRQNCCAPVSTRPKRNSAGPAAVM